MKRSRRDRLVLSRSSRAPWLEPLEARVALTGTIEGVLWNDWDRNGERAANPQVEYRIADVTVHLLDRYQQIVASTTTRPDGKYEFAAVTPNDYLLEFVIPDDTEFTEPDQGGENKDSDVDPATGHTDQIRVGPESRVEDIDVGIFTSAGTPSIRGRVWNDRNANGVQDPDEPGIFGAEVQLENRYGGKLLEVNTDSQGEYEIPGWSLIPGDYVVDFKSPSPVEGKPDWRLSPRITREDLDPRLDSDANSENGKTDVFSIAAIEPGATPNDIDLDGGFFIAAQILGGVWHDLDRNGIRHKDEYGVLGVPVDLLDSATAVVRTAVTDGNGLFSFDIAPGSYAVSVRLPDGVRFTASNRGQANNDSDVDSATGKTPVFRIDKLDQVQYIAAGVYSDRGTPSITGRIWHDLDVDGIQDPDEPGIDGAELEVENGLFEELFEFDADRLGNYSLDGTKLLPGTYYLDFNRPGGNDQRSDWQISPRNVGGHAELTSDSDAQPNNGKTPRLILDLVPEGRPRPVLDRDAGFFRFGHVTGLVWNDVNGDGRHDPAEPGVSGVQVDLLNAAHEVVNSVNTDSGGTFAFDSVLPGRNYSVQVDRADGATFAPRVAGANSSSSVDPSSGRTAAFDIFSGQLIERWAGLRGNSPRTGFRGNVWRDTDGDGIRGVGERGLNGVKVLAYDSSNNMLSAVTKGDGVFELSNIAPGTYTLEFELPAGGTFSPLDRGPDDRVDSDVNRWTRRTKPYSIVSGQLDSSVAAGVYSGGLSSKVKDSVRVTEVAFIGHGQTEFVELKNIGQEPVDMAGVRFVDGVQFNFSDSAASSLFPGEHAILVGKNHNLAQRPDLHKINIAGIYQDDLNREERITVVDRNGAVVSDFKYNDDWYVLMDNEYLPWTLTVVDELADPAEWNSKANWRPSSFQGGSPGSDDPRVTRDPGAVIINEVLTHTSDGFNDLIELHNTTDTDIDVGYWYLGDRSNRQDPELYLTRYRIAPRTIIPAHGYVVFSRQKNFANPLDPGLNSDFGLSSFGESVHLVAADSFGNMLGYADSVSFPGADTDVSFGRVTLSDGSSTLAVMERPTFGGPNSDPKVGPLVIDQVMYKTAIADEYIRLVNTSTEDILLNGKDGSWRLDGAVEYRFDESGSEARVPAGSRAFVVPILPEDFRQKYSIPNEIVIFGPFRGALDNGGEELILFRPGSNGRSVLVDRLKYDNVAPWPWDAAQGNVSLVRTSPDWLGDDPGNWFHSRVEPHTHLGRGWFVSRMFDSGADMFYGHDPLGLVTTKALAGDANGDGQFNSRDLVQIFQAGKYRGLTGADWTEGDWNADGYFDEQDLIVAFQQNGYELASSAVADPAKVEHAVDAVDHFFAEWPQKRRVTNR
jgi:hypothetical protein